MNDTQVDLSNYHNRLTLCNKAGRMAWMIARTLLFRPFPSRLFKRWRTEVLRLFGAKLSKTASVHASARIWAPWNLEMGDCSTISDNVDCYNVDKIVLGNNVTVSQRAFLCTASHDIRSKGHELLTSPITIGDGAWVAAESFVGMGIRIGKGAVVGARAVVTKDIEPWSIVGGNPAKKIGTRSIT